jgi:hypothetical protein
MTENEQFIYESIYSQVRMGFNSIEDIKEGIIEEIEDNGFENEISQQWAFDYIDAEWKKLFEESKHWKKPTDTDRLVQAFDELCQNNIIALHNAGYTISDGEYEVVEIERELQDNQVVSDGYCFYHEQDLARAIYNGNPMLYIAFNKIDNTDDAVTIEVGKKIVAMLKKYNFEVEWNEKPTTRIAIKNFSWKLIYAEDGRDLLDYDDVLEMMIK